MKTKYIETGYNKKVNSGGNGDKMSDYIRPSGTTTVAPEVLVTIAQLNTISVPGVSRLIPIPVSVDQIFKRGLTDEGVRIVVENNIVYADINVVIKGDENVREVSRAIQNQVARSISEMVGMEVGKVNVHVEDIDYNISNINKTL